MTVEVNKLSASERKVADKYYVLDNFFFFKLQVGPGTFFFSYSNSRVMREIVM